MEKQNRWRSKVLWVSICAQVLALTQLTGLLKQIGLDAGLAGNIIAGVLGLLVTFGILNDPTNPEGL